MTSAQMSRLQPTSPKAGDLDATNGMKIMMHKIAMVLAAAAVVTTGSASTASARGGGGGGHGFGGGGGFSHGFVGPGYGPGHGFGHDSKFVSRFHVYGVAGAPYGDGCYARVLTPWGWRWRYACY
jgi:uncharacterized membrane protein